MFCNLIIIKKVYPLPINFYISKYRISNKKLNKYVLLHGIFFYCFVCYKGGKKIWPFVKMSQIFLHWHDVELNMNINISISDYFITPFFFLKILVVTCRWPAAATAPSTPRREPSAKIILPSFRKELTALRRGCQSSGTNVW